MSKCKIIANYLPQYHRIPENDMWWGDGFTDWVVTKKAKPLFDGHNQPRQPLNDNYYDLSKVEDIRWQVQLAKKYGVYGFGIYHYWFNSNQMLLNKPAEIINANGDIDINYHFIWDNASWIRTWKTMKNSNQWVINTNEKKQNEQDDGILAKLDYGNESDWKKHYDYLRQHFIDNRYIKIDNKPVFTIFNPMNETDTLKKMIDYWDILAKQDGFNGIFVVSKKNHRGIRVGNCEMTYEPGSCMTSGDYLEIRILVKIINKINKILKKPNIYQSYDSVWKRIIKKAELHGPDDVLLSGFVDFDDTPRRGNSARIILGSTPDKFYKYLKKLIEVCNKNNKEFLYITAWNEWGEGAYLEPDKTNGYKYLEALKKAIDTAEE